MIDLLKKNKCSGCHACASACPKNCITMVEDAEGFLYPKVDETQCSDCGLCEKVCPIITPCKNKGETEIKAYAMQNKERDICLESSSGGVFTAIATEIISRGGVVFGAAFDEKFNVVHKGVNNVEDLQQLRGSKYVQSTIKDAYQRAERYLQDGKWVLFTGTPCQIGGLHAYLNKAYARLITQDIICHGVPSPMVWRKYLEYRKDLANGANPRKITFRSKDTGWKRFSVAISFDNNVEYCKGVYEDAMMKAFLQNLRKWVQMFRNLMTAFWFHVQSHLKRQTLKHCLIPDSQLTYNHRLLHFYQLQKVIQ